jgi:hypothetical protein
MAQANFAKLDPHEEHFRIPSPHGGLSLFLRYLPASRETQVQKNVVLCVHGGTFPSGLSIAHRFNGISWRDELVASGFHCWGLDFHGFGRLSDPYPEMSVSGEKPTTRPWFVRPSRSSAVNGTACARRTMRNGSSMR